MGQASENKRSALYREIESLPVKKLEEVLSFVRFMKLQESLDPDQLYFLTKEWQKMEKTVNEDKRKGDLIGDGTPQGLIAMLKR